MVATIFVSLEGVNLSEWDCVIRELSVYFCETGKVQHFTFDPPDRTLSPSEKKTDNYVRQHLGGVGVFDEIPGSLSNHRSQEILTSLGGYQILCAGNVAFSWIKRVLPFGDVKNIQINTDFKFPRELQGTFCGVVHTPRYCSLSKLWVIVYYFRFSGKSSVFNFTM